MHSVLQDLRYGFRMLLKSPGFTAVAVLTLALGIGANTAIFSVVRTVLLRPLPFPQPEQLLSITEIDNRNGAAVPSVASYPDFFDFRERNRSFAQMTTYRTSDLTVTGLSEPLHVPGAVVASGFFETLGVPPALGGAFRREDEQGGHDVVVLSHAFWRARLSSDPNIVGRTLELNHRPFTVAGVMPPGFQFPITSTAIQMWIASGNDARVDSQDDTPVTKQRGAHFLHIVARLKPGVSLEQARSDINAIAQGLAAEHPESNTFRTSARVEPQLEALVGESRTPLTVLLAAVACVLLIACANVANLLLARGSSRSKEIAVRAALGASAWRIARQLVTESVLLAFAGAAFGLALAAWSLSALLRIYPSNLPRLEQVGIDPGVLLFTIAISVVSAVLFGLAPALQSSRPNLEQSLKETGRSGTSAVRQGRLRSALVVAETALGVILLVGAGLLIRSFHRLTRVDPGFKPDHVLTASFDLPSARYDTNAQDRFYRELFERLNRQPGITSAAGILPLPLSGYNMGVSFEIEGRPVATGSEPTAGFFIATPGYFETVGIPLLHGRTFNDRDLRRAAPVVIVTHKFAQQFFPGEDAIGKHIKPGVADEPGGAKMREIVGVVGDVRSRQLARPAEPAFYIPLSQMLYSSPIIVARTPGAPAAIANQIRSVLSDLDAQVPLYDVRTLEETIALSVGQQRFQTVLLGLFAAIALLLAAVGLYGVMAYSVAQRTHEIGIRMALGASRPEVLGMVLWRGALLAGTGLALGVVGALALTRVMRSMVFQTGVADPLTFVAVAVVLGGAALLASYIPARRATRIDPMVALRYE